MKKSKNFRFTPTHFYLQVLKPLTKITPVSFAKSMEHYAERERGFTVMEVLIVVAVLAALATVTFSAFSNLSKSRILEKDAVSVVSLMNEARSLTLSSLEDSQYGVHLESSEAVLFKGLVYNSSDPDNQTITFHQRVTLSTISLVNGPDVIFKKLSGSTEQFGTTTMTLSSNPIQQKDVILFTTGIVEIK
jgi:prepilin-type N-terminal cleavage/methylation domain-containing protein